MKINVWFVFLLAFVGFLGYQFSRDEQRIKQRLYQSGLELAKEEVRGQWQVTKDWANSLWNYWSSIFKK